MKKSTINDIAKRAGVSSCTVSRVFNNHPYVKEEIRSRVLDAAMAMEYNPKSTARRDTISVILPGKKTLFPGVYEQSLVNSLFSVAGELNMNLEFLTGDKIDRIYKNFSKAVIAAVYHEKDAEILHSIKNIPVLTVNCIIRGCNYVCTDHEGGIYDAVCHLIEKGHRKIALCFASFEQNIAWGEKERLKGYRRALREHGIPFRRELVNYGTAEEPDRTAHFITQTDPDALIVSGESLTMPVLYTLSRIRRKIPDDISVVTFYSHGISPWLIPEPTCICQDFELLAKTVMEKTRALILGETCRVEVLLKNRFIEGGSVRSAPRTER